MTNQSAAAKNEINGAPVDVDLTAEASAGKEGKTPKTKLVRDSFTIPKTEYVTLNELRQRSTKLAQPAKKSELLRAGIALLKSLSDQAFLEALAAVPNLKTGRPKKEGEEGDAPAVKTGRKIIDKIAKRPARGTAKAAGEAGVAKPGQAGAAKARAAGNGMNKPAKSPAQKAAKAARKVAGAKAKAGKAAKAAKANRAARTEVESEEDL